MALVPPIISQWGIWPRGWMNGPFVVAGGSVAVPASRTSPGPETLDKDPALGLKCSFGAHQLMLQGDHDRYRP